jgi:hypothetical protein
MIPEITKIEDINWPIILKRLALWTARKLPRHMWRGARGGAVPGAMETQDFVQSAIMRALERRDEWVKDAGVDQAVLMKILYSHIAHRISDVAARSENSDIELSRLLDANPDNKNLSDNSFDLGSAFSGLFRAESEVYENELQTQASALLANDPEAANTFNEMMTGLVKPAELSSALGVSVRDIDAVKRRIQRKLSKEFADSSAGLHPKVNDVT